jgi:tRNA threonylcarbamoyladenosine biosynthesis protein TsaE
METLTLNSPDEAYSLELGRRIGAWLQLGDILALLGELGAGKTLLTRGIARGLGIPSAIPITSPTFTFINEYEGRLHLYHMDLYRLTHTDELDTLPWREALFGEGVAVIEWPERLGDLLPEDRFDIRITITGDDTRTIEIIAHGEGNTARLQSWAESSPPLGKDDAAGQNELENNGR